MRRHKTQAVWLSKGKQLRGNLKALASFYSRVSIAATPLQILSEDCEREWNTKAALRIYTPCTQYSLHREAEFTIGMRLLCSAARHNFLPRTTTLTNPPYGTLDSRRLHVLSAKKTKKTTPARFRRLKKGVGHHLACRFVVREQRLGTKTTATCMSTMLTALWQRQQEKTHLFACRWGLLLSRDGSRFWFVFSCSLVSSGAINVRF